MDGDLVGLVLKAFGPAGGLAVLLLVAAMWDNWKLVTRLNDQHDQISAVEKAHVKALAECQAACEREKLLFRETLDKRYQEAVAVFLQRDNEKRQDIATMFERFEHLVGVVSDGLTQVTNANQELRYAMKGSRGRQ